MSLIPSLLMRCAGVALFVLTFSFPCSLGAQSGQGLNTVSIPPSPDAASLGGLIASSPGLSAGSPRVSLPIYTLSSRNLSTSVELVYNSSGIKVDEVASRVGLGWVLSAGGVISRTVNGYPDELPGGFFSTASQLPAPLSSGAHKATAVNYSSQEYAAIKKLAEGAIDGQPDHFSVRFPGGSFRMFFDIAGNAHLIPYGLVEVDVDWSSNTWTLRTPDGTSYTFGGSAIESSQTTVNGPELSIQSVSAWYLTKMTGPFGDEITFTYENEGRVCYDLPESQTEFYNVFPNPEDCSDKPPARTWGATCVEAIRIREINSARGSVRFDYAPEGRTDNPPSKALREIGLLSLNGEVVKSFRLEHSYWSGRLVLDRVIEHKGAQAIPAHEFTYDHSRNLPPVGSYQRDHWGYYNGKPNVSLVPKTEFGCRVAGSADRSPDFSYGKLGMLTKVTYPTGGHSAFEYEPHSVWTGPNGRSYQTLTVNAGAGCSDLVPRCSGTSPPSLGTGTFSVAHPQCARVAVTMTNSGGNPCGARAGVYRVGSTQPVGSWDCPPGVNRTVYLPQAGDYELRVQAINGGDSVTASVIYEKEIVGGYNREIGGPRLAKVTVHDGEDEANDMVTEYLYEDPASPGQSSGVLVREPRYLYEFQEVIPLDYSTPGEPTPFYETCTYTGVQAFARNLYGNGGGSHIHYSSVRTNHGAGGSNGYSLHRFTTSADHPDPAVDFPFGLEKSRDHLRGLPTYTGIFEQGGKKVSEQSLTYLVRSENKALIRGYMAAFKKMFVGITTGEQDELIYRPFDLVSEWYHLSESVTRSYDENGLDYVETYELSSYDNPGHIQLTERRRGEINGRELITRISYPKDYSNNGLDDASRALTVLRDDQFRWSVPVETTTWQQKGGAPEELLGGTMTMYKEFTPGVVQPHRLLFFESGEPVSDYVPSSIVNGAFTYDSRYAVRERVGKYTGYGQVVEVEENNGTRAGYLWGYGSTLPVAKVVNGTLPVSNGGGSGPVLGGGGSGPVLDGSCSYTGFETGEETDHNPDEGYWTFQPVNSFSSDAHSGMFSRLVSAGTDQYGPVRELRPNPQSGKIVFSAWVKAPSGYRGGRLVLHSKADNIFNAIYPAAGSAPSVAQLTIPSTNNKWQYLEVVIDLDAVRKEGRVPRGENLRVRAYVLNQDNGQSLLVDDLRIHPSGARMESYTYHPLVGKTSELDQNNMKTSYSYDELNRLEMVLDHQEQIRQRHRYQYALNSAFIRNDLIGNLVYPNTSVSFTASASVDASEATWTWDFGDGATQTGSSHTVTHSYSNPGTYTLTLTVRDSDGNIATATQMITVIN